MTEPQYAVTYVEIDVSVCSLAYGVGACPAVLGVDSPIKCFNSFGTCPVPNSFSAQTTTLRFAIGTDYLQDDIEAIPILDGVSFSPGRISLGRDLGQRSSLTATFSDIQWSDTSPGTDPYFAERDYNPFEQGTFWGKFRARQPSLRGQAIRVIRGDVGQAIGDMETRHYVVESYEGPTPDGKFTITAKDVLKLLDGDRAQVPAVSTGRFGGAIDDNDTAVTLTPTGVGNTDYPTSGYLTLGGKEIAHFNARTGDSVTLDARGQLGTTADDHASGDRIQLALHYVGEDPADIIYDIMIRAGVDSSFIDLPAWQAETAAFNERLYTGTIAEPTSAKALIEELIEQAGLAIWWDDELQLIRLQVIRPVATDAERFDYGAGGNVMEETLSIGDQPEKRISQVWTYFGQANPLEGQEDPNNYRSLAVTVDTDSEGLYGQAIHKVWSRWIPEGGRTTATRLNDLLLARYANAPRVVSFEVFRDGISTPTLGEGCQLSAWSLQDATGAQVDMPVQITRINPASEKVTVEAEEMLATALADSGQVVVIDADTSNVNLRTLRDNLYPALQSGDTVYFRIESWVEIGSISTSTFALETGDWSDTDLAFTGTRTNGNATLTSIADTSAFAAGMAVTGTGIQNDSRVVSKTVNSVTLDKTVSGNGATSLTLWTVIVNVEIYGVVSGRGGNGGNGSGGDNNPGGAAGVGGPAFRIQVPINLTGNGVIQGGGGGGGAGGGDIVGFFGPQQDGGGGGGGAGIPGGTGGNGNGPASEGSPGTQTTGGTYGINALSGSLNPGNGRGGAGGNPGVAGGNATGGFGSAGAAAGNAIDGTSLLNTPAGWTGTISGNQVN